jgi:hypothetical protein
MISTGFSRSTALWALAAVRHFERTAVEQRQVFRENVTSLLRLR